MCYSLYFAFSVCLKIYDTKVKKTEHSSRLSQIEYSY